MGKELLIERLLRMNDALPVLFVSRPEVGDLFQFGTYEELENELEVWLDDGFDAELSLAGELLMRLDFNCYEKEPEIIR